MWRLTFAVVLAAFATNAENINSWQPLQPSSQNYKPRTTSTGYSYGWPSGGTSESDVAAQWIFDEASGNITDEVNSIVLTARYGPMTYEVAATGAYAGLSPGISFPGNPTYGDFKNTSPVAAVAVGTNDFVLETWIEIDTHVDSARLYKDMGNSGTTGIDFYWSGSTQFTYQLKADDTTTVYGTFTIPNNAGDSTPHKWRLAADRSGNMEMFVDGTSMGTIDISGVDGKTISSYAPQIGDDGFSLKSTLYELRLTIGNATNNSGGPNGG